jgi:putative endonuclease
MFYVYILQNERDNSFYIGHIENVQGRLKRHNEGRSGYTKSKGSWRLIYLEELISRSEAMRREREIKKKKSKKHIGYLVRTSRQ